MQFHVDHQPPHYETVAKLPSWHGARVYPRDTEFYYTILEEEVKDILSEYDIVLHIPEQPIVLLRRKPAQ